jgi:catalase-peroxidase
LAVLEGIQSDFNDMQTGDKAVSLTDLIVLGAYAAIGQAARAACHVVQVPFSPGRTDTTQEQTDVEPFAVFEPIADGFRNYLGQGHRQSTGVLLLDRTNLLTFTAPKMTVLVGGTRVPNANVGKSALGVFTSRPETLRNDFLVNLLDTDTQRRATYDAGETFEGIDRATGAPTWTASRAHLVFGSNSQLRAIAEVCARADSQEKFVRDFVAAWDKVMNLDRFDLA